ncbi:MAG: pilus assembly PilX N-terminal domain-containing protein [Syntrophobacterales bacterium]|nr:pilus assembly PilX N-terminal domain-containing protein [Syntrophobacterales bacterium]
MKAKKQVDATANNEKGMALVATLLVVAALIIFGTTAVMQTSTDLKIGGNYKTSEEAFYTTEAGIEEARARLRKNAISGVYINDGHPTSDQWRAYIGTDVKAKGKGYDNTNAMHIRVPSIQTDLDYVVEIIHQTDTSGNILYWGDSDGDGDYEPNTTTGKNIYLVESYGYSGTSSKTVMAEMTRFPPVTAPGALYVEAPTTIMGASTHIIGLDSCGSDDKPGIVTTCAAGSITFNPSSLLGTNVIGAPDMLPDSTNMDVQSMVDGFKGLADFTYTVNSATHTGMSWGTPTLGATLQDPSSCSCNNIVYYDTQNTDIKLTGGTTGCGMLLVEGDLEISGGFSWYGIIIATGSVRYTGGGDKNVTGAMISGGSVDADVVGGNSNIVYCSSAIDAQTENRPLRILSWKEQM